MALFTHYILLNVKWETLPAAAVGREIITINSPQILEVSFIACNLLKHTLDKVPIGFHTQNFTQNCTQPCFPTH